MLEPIQSSPGNRFSGPDGKDYDIIARVATDAGPFVVVTPVQDLIPDLSVGLLVNEGTLRDHEDVEFVSTTAAAKAADAKRNADAEEEQRLADRQARIDAETKDREEATGTTGTTDGAVTATTDPPPTTTS